MTFSIPVAGLLPAQFTRAVVGDIKWFEEFVKMLRVWNLKNKFLQRFRIFQRIIDGFIESFNMKITFKVFHIFHKEIKQILTIGPVAEQNGEFIRLFALSFDSPKMVKPVYYPDELHIL